MWNRKNVRLATEVVIVGAAVVIAGLHLKRTTLGRTDVPTRSIVARDTVITRQQTVLTFIADLNCPTCRSEQFQGDLQSVLVGLKQEIEGRGEVFYAVGVVVTPEIPEGIEYLERIGEWDEISIGGSGLNTHAKLHFWDTKAGWATPLIVTQSRRTHISPLGQLLFSDQSRSAMVAGGNDVRFIAERRAWDRLLPPRQETTP